MRSTNPVNNEIIREYKEHTPAETSVIIEEVHSEWLKWKETTFDYRAGLFRNAAKLLRERKDTYARLMTSEMGKIIRESQAEIEKCANACDFYAEHAASMLQDQIIASDASRSLVVFQPLGVILAVMPWNFPFWQVFRFAAPSLMAGNAAVLKHASNVPGCALAIEEVFRDAGFPANLFRTLMIPSSAVKNVIENPFIVAATLTGSEYAGSEVASAAGKQIKKTVLELGGSDAFIILEDADMVKAVKTAITARMINQGQSCIAAKRFIVVESRVAEFEEKVKQTMESLKMGDPLDPQIDVGPMARKDLVEEIDRQVQRSVSSGARLVLGGKQADRPGCYYLPTIISGIRPGMATYHEETFGPVISIIPVKNEEEAIAVANDSEFGLGGSVWTEDLKRGEAVARKIETGAMFVNGLVKSDPRLPFGGIKKSGYGRELSDYGIKEFVNIKTIWIA
ncbi:MAG: NAD-dependent succinate-semialdehyde dehydrogenase [Bacteroidetes bacterium]|nr:NAD-dependent succinate-semialdehyde dehydrogenase [Bacteroidota bacterium]